MEKIIPVNYENKHCYNILIQRDFKNLILTLKNLGLKPTQKICIVTESNVNKLYGNQLKEELKTYFDYCTIFEFKAGEEHKHLGTVSNLYHHLIEHSFDRKDILVALGGGVTGDMTGFTASTYLRGIDFIQIPTTLLSFVDSSIGGKTGVDFLQFKNMVGAFYMPRLVYINIDVLHTLSDQQFSSGMAEVIKHGLIKNNDYFEFIKKYYKQIIAKQPETIERLVYESCIIKKHVVENDPKEHGERALLNFGHTVGHAIEKLSEFKLAHGECVALGIICASYISCENGTITKEDFSIIEETMKQFSLPISLKNFPYNAKDILETTRKDKKMESGKVKFVLLQTIGNAFFTKELSEQQILSGIEYIIQNRDEENHEK